MLDENLIHSVILGSLMQAGISGDNDQVVNNVAVMLHIACLTAKDPIELTHFITY